MLLKRAAATNEQLPNLYVWSSWKKLQSRYGEAALTTAACNGRLLPACGATRCTLATHLAAHATAILAVQTRATICCKPAA